MPLFSVGHFQKQKRIVGRASSRLEDYKILMTLSESMYPALGCLEYHCRQHVGPC